MFDITERLLRPSRCPARSKRRPPILFPTLSYAEIHYRPGFVPSRLFRREPEILFDAPGRVTPGRPVPLFLIVKDAHRFPAAVEEVTVVLEYGDRSRRTLRFPYGGLAVNEPLWWDCFNVVPERPGPLRIHPRAVLRAGGKRVVVTVDNYPGSSRRPLLTLVSTDPLPSAEGWLHGDIHCHTAFTDDQIEFGAPVEASALAGAFMGLDWMALTDHSYDLDDRGDDYRAADPGLEKWHLMRGKAALLSESLDGFTVIPGEEATCRTRKGRNCHMLALGSERFIHGSGDGGEHGLRTRTEHSLAEAAALCVEWGGFACAAHPFERVSWPERLILNRGEWGRSDLETPGITALQIHNGIRDGGFSRGMRAWIRLLLAGKRIAALGGNDSHGGMNRRREISVPLLSVGESGDHLFGAVRTVVRAASRSAADILDALRNGRAQVTEGPFIDLAVEADGARFRPGDTVSPGRLPVRAEFLSSPEFGALRTCRLLAGVRGEREERVIPVFEASGKETFQRVCETMLNLPERSCLRAECETAEGKLAFTNPVWVE